MIQVHQSEDTQSPGNGFLSALWNWLAYREAAETLLRPVMRKEDGVWERWELSSPGVI